MLHSVVQEILILFIFLSELYAYYLNVLVIQVFKLKNC